MHSVAVGMWDPQPLSKHASPLPPRPPSNARLAHVTTATPAKRITFYKSGDSQFGGVRMAIHRRSFKCFDALLDDLSQKVPLPFGVRTVTTPRGTHTIKHLEQLQDGGCYLCSDRRQAKPINMELATKRPSIWYYHSRRPQRPESFSATPPGHLAYRQRRILLVKNSEPGIRRTMVLSRRSTRSLKAFLEEVSELMQFHVRKLYTVEGRRIDSAQSLMTCPAVLVCVGREAFSPMVVSFIRKSSEDKLPGLGSKSPGLGPRTPGNGARSPATQGARSPPHGDQSRASEYSEGHESKKNENFGLETKKSIIHPRSESSNRSARFSLSSEKSNGNGVSAYSQARPAIMNDDIEKRVLVNKDGSLSVEMRVRFRLHNDETVQWSTQIKKSPSLTNECCPMSQAQPRYLQQGQSESCSDPDFTSFEPDSVDYSGQPLQHELGGSHCPCCYHRQEQQYDLWENPAHNLKQAPVPPPYASSHAHTMMRHTHSSSSSSSCNSRRVVRCRARLSNSGRGSGSEQSQLVQEEMCVTEQVEHRVEQDGDTHVEVRRVSRCCSRSEVVAADGDQQPLSKNSLEVEEMEEEERPLSAVSSSSHVLQSLKEDQDDEEDDLPPSVSQCSHSNGPSPSPSSQIQLRDKPTSDEHKCEDGEARGSRAISAASSCHCKAATPHSTIVADEMTRASSSKSKGSRVSCRSTKVRLQNSEDEGAADNGDEEVKRVVSGLSCRSQQSGTSSVCSNCGGYKRGVTSSSHSRASQRSHHSPQASPNPASPLSNKIANDGNDDNGSDVSDVSTQSNKTNLTNHGGFAPSAISRTSNPEPAGKEEERAPSATSVTSHRSSKSQRSGCNGATSATADKDKDGSPSAMSARSNLSASSSKSHKSNCGGAADGPDATTREEAEGEDSVERAISSLSVKSGISTSASVKSHKSNCPLSGDNTVLEESDERAHSKLSVKSSASKSDKAERSASALSAKSFKSTKSNVSAKSRTSQRSTCSRCEREVTPAPVADEAIVDTIEKEEKMEERAASATSAKSDLSAKSHKSDKASERPLSPRSEAGDEGERAASQISGTSVKSNKSHCNGNENVPEEAEEKENEMVEETQQGSDTVASAKLANEERAASALSSKSKKSSRHGNKGEETEFGGEAEARAASALSGQSAASARSHHTNCGASSRVASPGKSEVGRTPSAMSGKSKITAKSSKSQRSNRTAASADPNEADVPSIETQGETQNGNQERVASAMSVKSKSSARSSSSQDPKSRKNLKSALPSQNGVTIKTPEGFGEVGDDATERPQSSASAKSGKSNVSSASQRPDHDETAHNADAETADADEKTEESGEPKSSEHSAGQTLSPRRACSPQTLSPKSPVAPPSSPQSPVQQLPGLAVGETRGKSALSVHSVTSAKSGRSKCHCGTASTLDKAKIETDGEGEEVEDKGSKEDRKSKDNERARSVMSASSKRTRRESEGTEQPLSRNSSGSVSLGLPDDQETGDSDSGKSSVACYRDTASKDRAKRASPFVCSSEVSHKSKANGNESTLSMNPPAVDIPTIETPGGDGEEQEKERSASAVSSKTSKSHKSSCKCGVRSPENDLETGSVKSASVKLASQEVPDNRTSSAMSSVSHKPASKPKVKAHITDKDAASVHSKSSCCLRPESAVSGAPQMKHSKQRKEDGGVKGTVAPPHTAGPKEEACSESALSHSLSAADLLKEAMAAAARPHSRGSKASRASDKPRSEKSGRRQRSRNQKDRDEEQELTPACLPNASPSEVVSDWLRSIPVNSNMLALGDEINEDEQEKEPEDGPEEEAANQESPDAENAEKKEEADGVEKGEDEAAGECKAAEEEAASDPAPDPPAAAAHPDTPLLSGESLPKNWRSSTAVMKVLLRSSPGRCQSMPEVSPVYGRRLSSSARGLLDCLAQLQLIEPALHPDCDQQKDHNQKYEDIMAILQSLWLTEPRVADTKENKGVGTDQVSPPRSSSGVGMSCGSGGSGKENGNQGDEISPKEAESLQEVEAAQTVVEEKDEGNAEAGDEETEAEPETNTNAAEDPAQSDEQSTVPPSLDSPKATENPSSSDKSSANDSSKSHTDNERETPDDSSSGTPPTILRASLTKRPSQDPDPVWVLHLLKKLEKQFMNHYINAMAEFKVRWDLDDSLILDTMISELRDEVSRRIQSSIDREMRKIQGRAGRGGRSPRPPQGANLSRESTMTEKRRRMLQVMKNQSVKTADSLSDGEMTGDFSDQRSEDEYCPCDACVRKKMAARPLKTNPMAAEAPVMMEFDLLKILQLKKSPPPPAAPQPADRGGDVVAVEEEGRSLEVVQEEEEEDETKEDIKAEVVLEETIPEEDEEEPTDQGTDKEEEGEQEEENSGEDEEQEGGETGGEEGGEEGTSGDEEVKCRCRPAKSEEESGREEEEGGTAEGGKAAETSDDVEDEGEKTGEEEGETAEDEGETGGDVGETETGEEEEEEGHKETVGEAETGEEEEEEGHKETVGETAGEEETTENGGDDEEEAAEEECEVSEFKPEEEGELTGRDSGEEEESEGTGGDAGRKTEDEESTPVEEFAEGNVSGSAEAEDEEDEGESNGENGGESEEQAGGAESEEEEKGSSQGRRASAAACVTEGEEADAEDSDADGKRPADTSADESGREGGAATGHEGSEGREEEEEAAEEDAVVDFKPEEEEEEESGGRRDDGALLHQFTRTSVESQPGSLEDIDADAPPNPASATEVPKRAGGGGVGPRRNRSPARAQRCKPRESDVELDNM